MDYLYRYGAGLFVGTALKNNCFKIAGQEKDGRGSRHGGFDFYE